MPNRDGRDMSLAIQMKSGQSDCCAGAQGRQSVELGAHSCVGVTMFREVQDLPGCGSLRIETNGKCERRPTSRSGRSIQAEEDEEEEGGFWKHA